MKSAHESGRFFIVAERAFDYDAGIAAVPKACLKIGPPHEVRALDPLPKPSPSAIGALSEFAVATALSRSGFSVFVPLFNPHSRIDLLYETADGIRRVQCKTAHLTGGFVSFWTCSNTGGVRKTYEHDVDDFGVYCCENESVYLVPVSDVPSRNARLRVDAPLSNQSAGIRWAHPYLVGTAW